MFLKYLFSPDFGVLLNIGVDTFSRQCQLRVSGGGPGISLRQNIALRKIMVCTLTAHAQLLLLLRYSESINV
jgi:hypothetical protein